MRAIPIMVGLLAPLTVQAAPVSQDVLDASFDNCVQRCASDGTEAQCTDLCACITERMAETWDDATFQARAEALVADPEDEQVVAEMSRFADQCATRTDG